jgi:hypothetical protein
LFKTLIASTVLAVGVATAAIAAPVISSATSNGPAQDSAFGADMGVVHDMLFNHDRIKRTVTNLPDGIRTVTESNDPNVAKEIKDHVASMSQRMKDGRVFNVASHTLPTLFANNKKVHTTFEQTPKGVIVTQTSTDPTVVAALQAHAGEVSDLARGGMVALMRQVQANGGPIVQNGNGPQGQMGPGMMRGTMGQGMMNHDGMPNGGPPMMAQMMQRMMQSGGPMGGMTGGPPMMRGQTPAAGGATQTTP